MDSPVDIEVENEFENRNVIGGLDRLILNIGLAVLAVAPTFLVLLFMPWRAAPLLAGDHAEGRQGAILGPGVFFVAALLAGYSLTSLIQPPTPEAVAEVATEISVAAETVADEAGITASERDDDEGMNSSLRKRLMASVSEGNVWKVASLLFPMFIAACSIAALSSGIGSLLLKVREWTLRAATGAGLYYLTTIILFLLFMSVIDDYFLPPIDERSTVTVGLMGLSFLLIGMLILPWQFFWFFKGYTGQRGHVSGLHAASLLGAVIAMFVGFSIWISITQPRAGAETPPGPQTTELVEQKDRASSEKIEADVPPEDADAPTPEPAEPNQ